METEPFALSWEDQRFVWCVLFPLRNSLPRRLTLVMAGGGGGGGVVNVEPTHLCRHILLWFRRGVSRSTLFVRLLVRGHSLRRLLGWNFLVDERVFSSQPVEYPHTPGYDGFLGWISTKNRLGYP